MVNSQVIREVIEVLKIDTNTESVPNPVPIVDVTPKNTFNGFIKSQTRTTTGSSTIFTTDSTRDTYVTGVSLSFIKDATCDIATGSIAISATIGGVAYQLLTLAVLTTTAQNDSLFISFRNPIKLDKGTTVTSSGTFTVGALARNACVYGFLDEVI